MKKKIVLFALAAATLSLASCGSNQPAAAKEATGYGVVNGDYIGFATMTVKDKKVETLKIDEAFTPFSWAAVTETNAKKLGEDAYVTYTSKDWGGNDVSNYYAKYILIGGEKFTGSIRTADLVVNGVTYGNEKVMYTSDKTPDLFKSWVESEDACKAYVDYYADSNFAIADKDFKLSSVLPSFTQGKYKSDGLYWNTQYGAGSGKLGWTGNIAKIEEALVGITMGSSTLAQDEESNVWKVDGIATGATITNFKDYYEVCQRAYNKLVK